MVDDSSDKAHEPEHPVRLTYECTPGDRPTPALLPAQATRLSTVPQRGLQLRRLARQRSCPGSHFGGLRRDGSSYPLPSRTLS